MSFGSLLRHSVTVMRDTAVLVDDEPSYDELGHPVTTSGAVATWRCLIQPVTSQSRELVLQGQAGATLSDHTLFGYPADVRAADRLVAADGREFEVLETAQDAGGQGHHLEVQVRLIEGHDVPEPEPS